MISTRQESAPEALERFSRTKIDWGDESYLCFSGRDKWQTQRMQPEEMRLERVGIPITLSFSLFLNAVGTEIYRRGFFAAPFFVIFDRPLTAVSAKMPKFIGTRSSVGNFHKWVRSFSIIYLPSDTGLLLLLCHCPGGSLGESCHSESTKRVLCDR